MDLLPILSVVGVHFWDSFSFLSGWVCQWKPFSIPIGDSFQKAYLEEWIHISDDSSSNFGEQCTANILTMVHDTEYKDCATIRKRPEEAPSASRSSWQASGEHGTPTWKISGTRGTASFWERAEAPLSPPRPTCKFVQSKELSPFPERLELPFSTDEILCGHEEIVSSGTDQCTAWLKMSPHEVLVRHMVDFQKATADFREALEWTPATSSHTVYKHFAARSIVQKRLSIYNWNPGSRRGKEDAFEKQIAGRWHISYLAGGVRIC